MPYNTELASALSGATQRQLATWRKPTRTRPAVLVPEYGKVGNSLLYSFRDLVALRTAVYLRSRMSLQKIRKAVGTIEDLDKGHLAGLTLYEVRDPAGGIVDLVLMDGSGPTSLVRKPNQQYLPIEPLSDILKAFKVGERVVPDLYRPHRHITVDPETRGGYPVVANTRVPFDLIADLLDDGYTPAQVTNLYPSVSRAAARAAQAWWHSVHEGRAA